MVVSESEWRRTKLADACDCILAMIESGLGSKKREAENRLSVIMDMLMLEAMGIEPTFDAVSRRRDQRAQSKLRQSFDTLKHEG